VQQFHSYNGVSFFNTYRQYLPNRTTEAFLSFGAGHIGVHFCLLGMLHLKVSMFMFATLLESLVLVQTSFILETEKGQCLAPHIG
jgi:hypothetical protein